MPQVDAGELLQRLVRFDTSNPPGNEVECITFLKGLLDEAGIETMVLAQEPHRPNLIARLHGRGDAAPLLLQGHVDVVTTANQQWTHPPFAGEVVDGVLWGRGTLDMKGGVAMMVAALLRAADAGTALPGDVILAALADEETSGQKGALFLVQEHAALFAGVRYAIGEIGGFTWHIAGRKFYPIQIGEKQGCGVVARLRGPGGHGALPLRGGAMAKLGRLLLALDQLRLPVHITPVVRQMITTLAAETPQPLSAGLSMLLDPATADAALAALGPDGRAFEPLLRNTASPTIVRGGEQVNVIPSLLQLNLDGRLLPGVTPDEFIAELRAAVGDEPELEVVYYDPYVLAPDMALYDTLAAIIREGDPEGIPMPYLLHAVTDARHFARLGIQSYGFTPLTLPPDIDLLRVVHAADERVPLAAIQFGAEAIYKLLQRYGQ